MAGRCGSPHRGGLSASSGCQNTVGGAASYEPWLTPRRRSAPFGADAVRRSAEQATLGSLKIEPRRGEPERVVAEKSLRLTHWGVSAPGTAERIGVLDGGSAMKWFSISLVPLALGVAGVLWASDLLDRPDLAFLDSFVASASATLALALLDSRGLL